VGHPRIAGGHHIPHTAEGHDVSESSEGFAAFYQLLAKHNVRIAMAGDTHDFEYYKETLGADDSKRAIRPQRQKVPLVRQPATAAQARHRLCLLTKSRRILGSSKPLSKPRLIEFRFFNLTLAEANHSIAAAAAQPFRLNSHARRQRRRCDDAKEDPWSEVEEEHCTTSLARPPAR
jgi:hypothetical protein